MCGITGFFHFQGMPENAEDTLTAMMAAIRHRGPDDQGKALGPWYALGHLRLSIIDLSPLGHQPMWSPDQRYCLIYNGEIYNYKELRADLQQRGYSFKGQSDTEVLLYGLIEYGSGFLKKLEGMFAGAFVDTRENEALLFRDQLGIKPLYYIQDSKRLAFASETKALWPFWGKPQLNQDALYEHFYFRVQAGDETLYRNVHRLEAGSCIHILKNGERHTERFFDITDHIQDSPQKAADPDHIQDMIDRSIRAHTISDVGYAVQLSGGVDSSYVTTVLSRMKPDLEAYAITLPGQNLDEQRYQKQVVDHCGIKLQSFPYTGADFARLLPEVSYSSDFPIVHGGSVFLYELCRHIGQKHKVVLTGEGADEAFLGYSRYHIPAVENIAFFLKQNGISASLIPDLPKLRGVRKTMQRPLGLDGGGLDATEMRQIINVEGDIAWRREQAGKFHTLLARMMATDQTSYLGSLFERQDKISMAHSVEVRVPFCTPEIFQTMNAIRFQDKTKPVTKAILKSLLAQEYPRDFVYRRKNGFALPFATWLRDDKALGPYLSLLTEPAFLNRDFVQRPALKAAIDQHRKGQRDRAADLMPLIMFAVWAKAVGV
mgnify:CR=1 FL=1